MAILGLFFKHNNQPLPLQVPIYTPGWRETIIVKFLAQGVMTRIQTHTLRIIPPELDFVALNRTSNNTLHGIYLERLLPPKCPQSLTLFKGVEWNLSMSEIGWSLTPFRFQFLVVRLMSTLYPAQFILFSGELWLVTLPDKQKKVSKENCLF